MAHEIDAVELVAEALAGGEGGLKIVLSQDVSVDTVDRHHGGIARLAADQRDLAEEIAETKPCNLAVGAVHLDLAIGYEEELRAGLALANDCLAGGVVTFRHLFCDIGQLPRGQ